MAFSSENDNTVEISAMHEVLLVEKELPNFFILYHVQVDSGEMWVIYRDGVVWDRLLPGSHTLWGGFFHKWHAQRVSLKVHSLALTIKGRVKGSVSNVNLAYGVEVKLEIAFKISNIETFLQYQDPLLVFTASIKNMVAEMIGQLPYDQYGQWATTLRDAIRERLQGGRDDSERLVGIRVEEVYVTSFGPDRTHEREGNQTSLHGAKKEFSGAISRYIDNSSTISIRIVEEPLTARNFSSIIAAFSELYTKCWLIANDQFAELIEYTQTRNSRLDERANLIITQLTYNSPAEIKFTADFSPKGVVEALKVAVDAIVQAPLRHREALLANQARELEIKTKEEEAKSGLLDKEQARSIQSQKAVLDKQKDLLELEKKQLEIEKERLNLQKEYLEIETMRIQFAIENANRMVDILSPSTDPKMREILMQTLLPNLLQLGGSKGLELPELIAPETPPQVTHQPLSPSQQTQDRDQNSGDSPIDKTL